MTLPYGPINLGVNNTLLTITPLSPYSTPILTPYSARGLTQTLAPIGPSGRSGGADMWLRRDINGNLIDVADPNWRKYSSEISCRDTETPCLDGAWLGMTAIVSCACELSIPTGGIPGRPVVSGSMRTEGADTFYRPQLVMMIADIKNEFREYEATYAWAVSLIEV